MNLSDLWKAWPITGPWQLSRLVGGTNNLIWRAEMADGQKYVLRIVPDLAKSARIRYEAALLEALADKNPPFMLPVPVRTHDGDSMVAFEQETGSPAIAILMPLLPGHLSDRPPERNDLAFVRSGGITLAWLDRTLAELPDMALFPSGQSISTFGELELCHPLVPNPISAIEKLPAEQGQIEQVCRVLTTVMERTPDLYHRLPQQLLHRDYDPANILVGDDHHVTAVLDFEFAGPDLRVLELCVSLSWWPVHLMGSGEEWELIDVFGSTYQAGYPLSKEELLAIPDVLRLRDMVSLIHRTGRYLAGLETDARMRDRVKHSLWREAWLSANRERLLQHALTWGKEAR